jgi:putative SOS response-associated peptidase YedK
MFDNDELEEEFGIKPTAVAWPPSENVSPGDSIPVITDAIERELKVMRWGLVPSWAKDPAIGYKTINARAETVAEKPSFRNAFAHRRCLILASGFYEWLDIGARKQPYRFTLKDHKLFTFAGLWENWQDRNGIELTTCTIITTMPNRMVAEIHDRMPVILDKDHCWAWLEHRPFPELQAMLVPYPAEKMAAPVMIDSGFFKKKPET